MPRGAPLLATLLLPALALGQANHQTNTNPLIGVYDIRTGEFSGWSSEKVTAAGSSS